MTHSEIPALINNDNNKQAARCRKWVVSYDAIVNASTRFETHTTANYILISILSLGLITIIDITRKPGV